MKKRSPDFELHLYCSDCDGDSTTAHIHGCPKALLPEGGCGGPWFCRDCKLHVLCDACKPEHNAEEALEYARAVGVTVDHDRVAELEATPFFCGCGAHLLDADCCCVRPT